MDREDRDELDPDEVSPRDAVKLLMGDTPLVELTLSLHEAGRALSVKEVRKILDEYPEDDVEWALDKMQETYMLRWASGGMLALRYGIVTNEILDLQYEVMEETRESRGLCRLEDAVRRP
jgi:hypothetical protein